MNLSPTIFSTSLQMLAALGIVLGGLIVVFYFMKRVLKRDASGSKEQLVKVIASQYIGIKKNISLVAIPGSVLVVGIANDNISLLTKIDDKVLIDALCQRTTRVSPSFSDHLQRLTDRFKSAQDRD
jgi:flagellar biogenesis protein FliO